MNQQNNTGKSEKYVSGPRGLELLHEAGIEVGKAAFYAGLGTGEIPSIRIGHRYYVPVNVVELMSPPIPDVATPMMCDTEFRPGGSRQPTR